MPGRPVQVLMVWEAVLPTDSDPPNARVLARASDPRVRPYWDQEGALSKAWQPVLVKEKTPVTGSSDLITGDVVWDVVAVFPPGVRWETQLPAASFKGAPVVKTVKELTQALGQPGV